MANDVQIIRLPPLFIVTARLRTSRAEVLPSFSDNQVVVSVAEYGDNPYFIVEIEARRIHEPPEIHREKIRGGLQNIWDELIRRGVVEDGTPMPEPVEGDPLKMLPNYVNTIKTYEQFGFEPRPGDYVRIATSKGAEGFAVFDGEMPHLQARRREGTGTVIGLIGGCDKPAYKVQHNRGTCDIAVYDWGELAPMPD